MVTDGPVIREQLPTWDDHLTSVKIEAAQEVIELLLGKGFVGAANLVSIDTYGYGMEDTNDMHEYNQMNEDLLRAADYVELEAARHG